MLSRVEMTTPSRSILTKHDVQELKELYRKLPSLAWEATNKLQVHAPATALEGADLQRFLAAHAAVVDVLESMRKFLG